MFLVSELSKKDEIRLNWSLYEMQYQVEMTVVKLSQRDDTVDDELVSRPQNSSPIKAKLPDSLPDNLVNSVSIGDIVSLESGCGDGPNGVTC